MARRGARYAARRRGDDRRRRRRARPPRGLGDQRLLDPDRVVRGAARRQRGVADRPTTPPRACRGWCAATARTSWPSLVAGLAERFESPRDRDQARRCATGSRCSRRQAPGDALLGALWDGSTLVSRWTASRTRGSDEERGARARSRGSAGVAAASTERVRDVDRLGAHGRSLPQQAVESRHRRARGVGVVVGSRRRRFGARSPDALTPRSGR